MYKLEKYKHKLMQVNGGGGYLVSKVTNPNLDNQAQKRAYKREYLRLKRDGGASFATNSSATSTVIDKVRKLGKCPEGHAICFNTQDHTFLSFKKAKIAEKAEYLKAEAHFIKEESGEIFIFGMGQSTDGQPIPKKVGWAIKISGAKYIYLDRKNKELQPCYKPISELSGKKDEEGFLFKVNENAKVYSDLQIKRNTLDTFTRNPPLDINITILNGELSINIEKNQKYYDMVVSQVVKDIPEEFLPDFIQCSKESLTILLTHFFKDQFSF